MKERQFLWYDYHKWLLDWQKDMEKQYSDKRRVVRRRFFYDGKNIHK